MAFKSKEAERIYQMRYREKNADALKARRASYYSENKDRILAAQKLRYEKNKDTILERQRAYLARRTSTTKGRESVNETARRWRTANVEHCRQYAKKKAAEYYRSDPYKAAVKRAKTILVAQTGLSYKALDPQLVEAKALQLMVRAKAVAPERSVGEVLSPDEKARRKKAAWTHWYEENREHRRAYQRDYNARKRAARDSDTDPKGGDGTAPFIGSAVAQPCAQPIPGASHE